ncbi:MAG: hypothetical protein M3Z30_08320 [Gemmatimonadota bacterium]|nr:hypothetical protein [Gemmatimonadota bacterium]
MDPTTSPFYHWLDHGRIRALLHDIVELRPGERLVLLKGLVPCLVETLGADEAESFLTELATKVRRYEEARTHPGEGRLHRETPGEQLGGPTPDGHRHVAETRNPDAPGGRAAEREREAAIWARDVDPAFAERYRNEVAAIRETYMSQGMRPGEADLAAWEVVARLHDLTRSIVRETTTET